MMKKAFLGVIALFVLVKYAQGQRIASVDLTKPPESPDSSETQKKMFLPNGCHELTGLTNADGVALQEGNQQPEIKVSIDKLSNKRPMVGSDLWIDVRLQNIGDKPIKIPWNADPQTMQSGQDPSHRKWQRGFFVVYLKQRDIVKKHGNLVEGADIADLKVSSGWLYSSDFSHGSQLTVPPGEWITATIKASLEDSSRHPDPLKIKHSQLSIEWLQAELSEDFTNCAVTESEYDFFYKEKNPTVGVRVENGAPVKGRPSLEPSTNAPSQH